MGRLQQNSMSEDQAAGSGRNWRTYRDDGCVVVEIGDNGPGISDDVLLPIFELSFTTKGAGEGTGLDTVRRFVKKHREIFMLVPNLVTPFSNIASIGGKQIVGFVTQRS